MLRQAQSLVSGTTPELSNKLKTWVKGLLIEVKVFLDKTCGNIIEASSFIRSQSATSIDHFMLRNFIKI